MLYVVTLILALICGGYTIILHRNCHIFWCCDVSSVFDVISMCFVLLDIGQKFTVWCQLSIQTTANTANAMLTLLTDSISKLEGSTPILMQYL